jgi:CRP-like cAMP-binding protein
MKDKPKPSFDPKAFLSSSGQGRSIRNFCKNQIVFAQGEPANTVFFLLKGKVKLLVI